MKPVQAILLQSRRALLALAGAAAVATALVLGSMFLSSHLKEGVDQDSAQTNTLQAELQQKQTDLNNIQAHIEKFHLLKQQGLVGTADREGWVEQFGASRQTVGLGTATVTYSLEPPKAVSEAAATPADDPAAVVVDPTAPLQHDLQFDMQGIHEVELLKFLQDYKTRVDGQFRIEACELGNPSATGLEAKCTLRFFNLPDVAKAS